MLGSSTVHAGAVTKSVKGRPQCVRRHSVHCRASQQIARPPQRPEREPHDSPGQAAGLGPGPVQPLLDFHQQQHVQQPQPQHQRAAYQQAQLQPVQRQQQAQQLLSRPSRSGLSSQQAEQPSVKKLLLDDADTKMAAFDELEVQVTLAQGVSRPSIATSFNRGAGHVRQVVAGNLRSLRIQRPTPLQGHLLPAIRQGHDVLAAGPPGAGTSTAALLAVLCKLLAIPRSMPRNKAMPLALLLCPNRELAMQLGAQGAALVAGTQLSVKWATGGTPVAQQVLELRHGADLLVCTPGRLMDLLTKKTVSLARLKYLIMEDIDELMGPVLLPVTRQVLHHHTMPGYQQRHTIALGSSALPQQQLLAAAADVLQPSAIVIQSGWPLPAAAAQQQQVSQQQPQQSQQPELQLQQPQQAVQQPARQAQLAALLANPAAALAVSAAAAASAIPPSVTQRFLGVAPQLKLRFLLRLLSGAGAAGGGGLVLVFTNSHTAADEVWQQLEAAGVSAGVLHYARSQAQRDEALQCFKYGVTQVLVACGIAYRGLDLPDVAQVVNYEVPLSLAEYARRLGRAGRAGRAGVGTTLVTPGDGAAVGPLVAVLRAGGEQVPDWLLALAENRRDDGAGIGEAGAAGGGDSSSSGGSVGGAQGEQQGAPAGTGGGSSSGVQAGSKQQGSSSSMFRVSRGRQPQFGAYIKEESDEQGDR